MNGSNSNKKVVILGINGRIGQEIAKAFVTAGYVVCGMGRDDRAKLTDVRFVQGNADSETDIERAVAGQDIVVNALNLPYDKWDKGRAEAQLARVLSALKGSGKLLMFPGNIYNFGADQHVLTPSTSYQPEQDKGKIRVRMEQQLEDAANNGDVKVAIIRSGDFYAPGASETNFDLAILARQKSKILQMPARLDMMHTWAFLPDLARVYPKVAALGDELGVFERFHFRGHFVSGHELVDAIQVVLPQKWKVAQLPWGIMGVIGWFVPVLREVVKMSYLFRTPHELRDDRLVKILGPEFDTPFKEAIAQTIRSYVPEALAKPTDLKLVAA